jgi:hypothetical protein
MISAERGRHIFKLTRKFSGAAAGVRYVCRGARRASLRASEEVYEDVRRSVNYEISRCAQAWRRPHTKTWTVVKSASVWFGPDF